jgi:hypothetical protein
MLENLGLSGFAFTGADVGGFAGTPTTELLTKWFEIGAFQPIDRDHTEKGTGDQEPWVGGTEQEAIRRHFIEYAISAHALSLHDCRRGITHRNADAAAIVPGVSAEPSMMAIRSTPITMRPVSFFWARIC